MPAQSVDSDLGKFSYGNQARFEDGRDDPYHLVVEAVSGGVGNKGLRAVGILGFISGGAGKLCAGGLVGSRASVSVADNDGWYVRGYIQSVVLDIGGTCIIRR